jgi:hypothetical protein
MENSFFLKMIKTLRKHEHIMLYGNILQFTDTETDAVVDFLQQEYQHESLNYPYSAPAFNGQVALWASKTIYTAAQLILYRENMPEDLPALFPRHHFEKNASAMLSADLCLRFLPEMISHLKMIDIEDPLILLLEQKLIEWHYSGVRYPLEPGTLDFTTVVQDKCLHQLYCNRIIEFRKLPLAKHPAFNEMIAACLGLHSSEYWKEFELVVSPTYE